MKRLFILGASKFGRELEDALEQLPDHNREWSMAGFLHHGPSEFDQYPSDYAVVGDWMDFQFRPDDMVIVGVTDVEWKRRLYETLCGKVEFMTFVHPQAIVSKFAQLGAGTVVGQFVLISTNVSLGACSTVNAGSLIGHDVEIGAYSSLMAHVDVGGGTKIGESVLIGTKATIVPKRKIGAHVKIAAGTVVMRNFGPNKTVFGNPAVELWES